MNAQQIASFLIVLGCAHDNTIKNRTLQCGKQNFHATFGS